MRLLLTTDTVGGVWTFTRELTAQLLRQGHAVALVSFGRLPSPEQRDWCSGVAAMYAATFRYEASTAPLEWMEANQTAYTAGESHLLRICREFSPDLLHSSQFCFGRLPVSIPKLVTAHSDVLSWAEACRPGGLEPSPWLTTYCRFVEEGLREADAVVAPTQWMLEALGRGFTLPSSRWVVPNGRSLADVEGTPRRSLQAISVGRLWDEAKNVLTLTRVKLPLPILIAGEPKLQSARLQTARGARSGSSLQLLGFLNEEQLFALFRSSSIYIVPSIYEPFGLAALEAALCGCAVLANDIASLREVWGDAALYFHNQQSLLQQLRDLLSYPELLQAAQSGSLARAQELTAERMAAAYLARYEHLLCPRTPAAPSSGVVANREMLAHAS